MAPGAELYLAAIGGRVSTSAAAVEWMHANGVKRREHVARLHRLAARRRTDRRRGQRRERGRRQAVNTDGMFWANAAGNFRLNHWKGDFLDRDGDFALNWDARNANLDEFYYDASNSAAADRGRPVVAATAGRRRSTTTTSCCSARTTSLNAGSSRTSASTSAGRARSCSGDARGDQPLRGGLRPTRAHGTATAEPVVAEHVVRVGGRQHAAVGSARLAAGRTAPRVDFDFFCPNQDLEIYARRAQHHDARRQRVERLHGGRRDLRALGDRATSTSPAAPASPQQEPYSSEGPNQRGVVTPEIAAPDDVTNHVVQPTYYAAHVPRARPPPRRTSRARPRSCSPRLPAMTAAAARGVPARARARARRARARQPDRLRRAAACPRRAAVDVGALAGADRYRTALAVSKTWASGSATSVVLASGADFPDALAGASLAGALGSPVAADAADRRRSPSSSPSSSASAGATVRRCTSSAASAPCSRAVARRS